MNLGEREMWHREIRKDIEHMVEWLRRANEATSDSVFRDMGMEVSEIRSELIHWTERAKSLHRPDEGGPSELPQYDLDLQKYECAIPLLQQMADAMARLDRDAAIGYGWNALELFQPNSMRENLERPH